MTRALNKLRKNMYNLLLTLRNHKIMSRSSRSFSFLRGFTMIEILVAMMVLAIGLLGMAGMTVLVMRGNKGAVDLTAATNICQKKIEELKDVEWTELGGENDRNSDNAREVGAVSAQMVQEGSIQTGEGLNSQGLTQQGFYDQEKNVAGSACDGKAVTDPDCAAHIEDAGPYKFARTFIVCKGNDIFPIDPPANVGRAPVAGTLRPDVEPDCLVEPAVGTTRSRWLTCKDTPPNESDITTTTGPNNKEKKVKVLCAWRGSDGGCHSVHLETTLVEF